MEHAVRVTPTNRLHRPGDCREQLVALARIECRIEQATRNAKTSRDRAALRGLEIERDELRDRIKAQDNRLARREVVR